MARRAFKGRTDAEQGKARGTGSRLAYRSWMNQLASTLMHLLADARRDHQSTCGTNTQAESEDHARRRVTPDRVQGKAKVAGERADAVG